jgi:hypothetical protein
VGDPRVFERLPLGRVKAAPALALHATRAALPDTLLPFARPTMARAITMIRTLRSRGVLATLRQ